MREFFWNHDAGLKLIFFFILLFSLGDLVYLNYRVGGIGEIGGIRENTTIQEASVSAEAACNEGCQKMIDQRVAEVVATISGQKKVTTIVSKVPRESQTTFIPLGGGFSTKETDWADVKNSEIYISIGDYGKDPYVDWNAFLKIAGGNGKAYARLYDVTHGIAVDGSEVPVSSQDFTQASSSRLNLWSGNNLYRVQVKSLNGQTASFDSGRVKIVGR